MQRLALCLLSILSMSIFAMSGVAQSPSPAVSATAPAFLRPHPSRPPIPLRWKITAVASFAVVSLTVLAFAASRWRTWNLFDRQYRFPRVETAALRLGGRRSGGCLSTIDFGGDSTAEDP